MGIFDFLKPKGNSLQDEIDKIHGKFFPKGDKDVNSAVDEILWILNNKISRDEAKKIALKSIIISRIAENFNQERLRSHLEGYCLHHFNDEQLKHFYDYLMALTAAMQYHRKTPSEVKRIDNGYIW